MACSATAGRGDGYAARLGSARAMLRPPYALRYIMEHRVAL